VFLEERHCGAAAVELDPDMGCLTYSAVNDAQPADEQSKWDEDEFEDEWEDEESLYENEDDYDEDALDDEDDEEY
jgi:hypothetical protein